MKKSKWANRDYKNSEGISRKEYRLGSRAGRAQNRERQLDFDYLDKLSPEEFAWLAEVNAALLSAEKADPDIVGEEVSEKLFTSPQRREAWAGERGRRRSIHNHDSSSIPIIEEIFQHTDLNNLKAQAEADKEIDRYWKEKRKGVKKNR